MIIFVGPRGKKSNAKKKGGFVPMRAIDLALQQCAKFLRFKTHEDLDADSDVSVLLQFAG